MNILSLNVRLQLIKLSLYEGEKGRGPCLKPTHSTGNKQRSRPPILMLLTLIVTDLKLFKQTDRIVSIEAAVDAVQEYIPMYILEWGGGGLGS